MKGIYSGNQDWLSRQRWIPIVLVVVTVVGGWVVGSKSKRGFADKDWEVQQGQQSKEAATGSTATGTDNSLGDAAKRMKHHKACLELKKDNPSIVCP